MKSVFKLDSQTTSKEVDRTRSFPQGDPAAPMIFNLVLDTLAETFIKTAIQKGWGKKLQDGSWVNLIMFADNYWFGGHIGPAADPYDPRMAKPIGASGVGNASGRALVVHDGG